MHQGGSVQSVCCPAVVMRMDGNTSTELTLTRVWLRSWLSGLELSIPASG